MLARDTKRLNQLSRSVNQASLVFRSTERWSAEYYDRAHFYMRKLVSYLDAYYALMSPDDPAMDAVRSPKTLRVPPDIITYYRRKHTHLRHWLEEEEVDI